MTSFTNTWILIADGGHGFILEHKRPNKGLRLVDGMVFGDTKPSASIERSDRPGRTFDSKGQGRHSLEPRSDTKLQYQTQFANNVSKTLLSQFQSKSFDQLVVVAPPTFMGILRQSLPKPLKSVLYGELTMDLVHEPIEKIGVHLEDILPV